MNAKYGREGIPQMHWMLRMGFPFVMAIGGNVSQPFAAEVSPAQIYASAAPAVVFIAAVISEGTGQGTGSIIDANGLVLTNAHVILDKATDAPAKKIFVFLKPDRVIGNENNQDNLTRRYIATVTAYDKALDLALLKVNNPTIPLPILPLADTAGITIGSSVLAIGHPESGGLWSLTTGVISAEWHDFNGVPGKDIFQTETSLNRGNSGGPLIDLDGHQVGVNSLIARKSQDGLAITSINFAIKANVAKEWLGRQGVPIAYAAQLARPAHERSAEPPVASESSPPPSESAKKTPAAPDKAQPAKVLENQPEAKPEIGPGLPPVRPFSLDRLMKGLDLVQKDLESQMEEMGSEIQRHRR
jgi:Trypsin-like serine proteases, typically periplasmic, contain C-terminal PDZ domain